MLLTMVLFMVVVEKADGAIFYNRFSKWTKWSEFDGNCGEIARRRIRECVTFIPWLTCDPKESTIEMDFRIKAPCPTATTTTTTTTTEPPKPWYEWSSWSKFYPSCGDMKRLRTRQCKPSFNCTGDSKEFEEKYELCPALHGGWGMWSGWRKRVFGKMMRTRICNNPTPRYGGRDCTGSSIQTRIIPSKRHKTNSFRITKRIVYTDEILKEVPSFGSIIACKMQCQLHIQCKEVTIENKKCYLLKPKGGFTPHKNFRRSITRNLIMVFSIHRAKKR